MAAPTPPVVPLPALRSDPATFKDRAEANIVFFQPLVEYMVEVCGFTEEKAAEALAAALAGDLPNISGKNGQVLYITGGGLGFKLVQTGVHDDTTNALMPVGAFGLGQKGSTTTATLNGTTRTGFYNYGATDPGRPAAITTGGSFIAVRYATSWISQIIFAPNANLVYYRYSTDNGVTWSAWTRMFLGSDLATPSQAILGANHDVLMTAHRTKQAIYAFRAPDYDATAAYPGAGSATSVAHGLGAKPSMWRITAQATVVNNGYEVGDEIDLAIDDSTSRGRSVFVNSSILGVSVIGLNYFVSKDGVTQPTINTAQWQLRFRAWV